MDNDGFSKDETQTASVEIEGNGENALEIKERDEQSGGEGSTVATGQKEFVGHSKAKEGPYAGMPKKVLLQYSRQRKFAWARNILTGFVIITILVLLALLIAIIVISPPCLEFWQTSPIYQIYPKSFRNAESTDSYGNLKGILEKLDYLNDELGVHVVAVNSVYESPQMVDGYDVSDFKNIDPVFGTMADMENLIIEMHDRGMKIVIDFVPNHSSNKHKWFLASSNTTHSEHEKYKNYYVWADGDNQTGLPNNWVSVLGNGSAWTWNDDRKQFYYHSFSSDQPDLNLRDEDVRNEIKEILKFWLEKGVDGFRSVGVAHMLEANHLRDNPSINSGLPASENNLYPDYTQNYQGVYDIVAEWRTVLDEYSTEPGVYRFMETQVYADLTTTLRYYGTDELKAADFPMNSLFVKADAGEWNAEMIRRKILDWMKYMPTGKWPNWMLSNHDNARIASRVGLELARSAAVLTMTLPGTPSLYYGDEIGMMDGVTKPLTENSLDASRSPMQWSIDANAGFCSNCTPWIPANPDYLQGVTIQNETTDGASMLSLYKTLISMRGGLVFQRGYFCMMQNTDKVLGYVRELEGLKSMMVLVNFQNETSERVNLTDAHPGLPGDGLVEFFSGDNDAYEHGKSIRFNDIRLDPQSSIIISYSSEQLLSQRSDMADNCFTNMKVCYNIALQTIQTC